ncbi:TetR family transcriptional regulator [Pseudomonas khavaziana]|uniref:TetR family transcriptional regulator n=1 Tax=Pseudomonas khavaziana TaxID=2842351 RepID=UPI001CED94B9|nr:TetR family transcriptional regulator [Pseudomonas khavaziana]
MLRIQKGRSKLGEKKLTIASVAREAGVSTALIHNHYPRIAEDIRDAQGRSSRAQRDDKHHELITERSRNKELRKELDELRLKVAKLASLNEVLLDENRTIKAKEHRSVTSIGRLP